MPQIDERIGEKRHEKKDYLVVYLDILKEMSIFAPVLIVLLREVYSHMT